MAVSKRLRFEILRRDDHTCRYCGRSAPDVPLRVDHVIPEALGGTDDPTNLVTACEPCNTGKSSIAPDAAIVADVATDAQRWAVAIKEVARRRINNRRELWGWFNMIWCGAAEEAGLAEDEAPVPADWIDTVGRFIAAGLPTSEIERYTAIAMQSNVIPSAAKWRYFCGCCWRAIRDLQDGARVLLAEGMAV